MLRSARLAVIAFATLVASPSWADAIDGPWCAQDGRRITIEGPRVVTPGGAAVTGRYARHDLSFVVPAGEPQAGATVEMVLRGEFRVLVRFGGGAQEEWNRCRPGIS